MNGRKQPEVERRSVSALGAATLALIALVLGTIAWLWHLGPPSGAPAGQGVVMIPMPPAPPPGPAATPAPAAPPAPSPEAARPEPPKPEPPKPESPKAEAAKPAPQAPPAPPLPETGAKTPESKPPAPAPAAPSKEETANDAKLALLPAPVPDLIESGKAGPLPRVAPDGRLPWKVYARPFDKRDTRPRIAMVIGNLGMSGAATEAAIQQLPGGITLAFSPYSHRLEQYIPLARAAGHEVLLGLPMEPVSYPINDPGPQALLTALTPEENLGRLSWLLSRFTGYVGVTNYMGSRFTTSDQNMRPILEELHRRGLLFFDSRSASHSIGFKLAGEIGLPTASNARFIDVEASRPAIDLMLQAVEEEAKAKGASIAMGFPYPVTIERVAAWSETLPDKGFVLAPVSAMVSVKGGG